MVLIKKFILYLLNNPEKILSGSSKTEKIIYTVDVSLRLVHEDFWF